MKSRMKTAEITIDDKHSITIVGEGFVELRARAERVIRSIRGHADVRLCNHDGSTRYVFAGAFWTGAV